MIHLHSMFSSETNTSNSGQTTRAPLSQSKLDSFHGALSDAVSSTLEKFGIHPSEVKISITPATAHASTVSDRPIRTAPSRPTPPPPANTPSGTGSSSSGASGAPNGGYDPFLQAAYNNPYQSTPATSATATVPKSNSTVATETPQQAFDDAYWAGQPAAVQALRNVQDPGQRAALATQLANEGYSIDVPIMVWGWDPSITTSMRQADGYTWVPSALQNPIELAPGLPAMGGVAAYNPNNPPSGSIPV